mmetsp:Transcript_18873/g.40559  ORF Transcript_18873/g.40559 Transcript_18873/m.40559 type:complete len:83 (+) Transcript_18873:194-442(+)
MTHNPGCHITSSIASRKRRSRSNNRGSNSKSNTTSSSSNTNSNSRLRESVPPLNLNNSSNNFKNSNITSKKVLAQWIITTMA